MQHQLAIVPSPFAIPKRVRIQPVAQNTQEDPLEEQGGSLRKFSNTAAQQLLTLFFSSRRRIRKCCLWRRAGAEQPHQKKKLKNFFSAALSPSRRAKPRRDSLPPDQGRGKLLEHERKDPSRKLGGGLVSCYYPISTYAGASDGFPKKHRQRPRPTSLEGRRERPDGERRKRT